MNLEQALEIVRDHIRIGKGMELVNGVPEALEMVVEELAVTQKALDLYWRWPISRGWWHRNKPPRYGARSSYIF